MSVEQSIASLTAASNKLTGTVSQEIGNINKALTTAKTELNSYVKSTVKVYGDELATHISAKNPHPQYLLTDHLPEQMKKHQSLGIIDRGAAPKAKEAPSVWGNPGEGFDSRDVYALDYPETYGNIYTMQGRGYTQIFQSWSGDGSNKGPSHLYLRMKRDTANNWGPFSTVWDSVNLPKASESVAQAGTDDTHWMSPLTTQQAVASYLKNHATGLGVGQKWTDVKSSRAVGTTYTNTTGRPILVSVSPISNSTSSTFAKVNGIAVARQTKAPSNSDGQLTFIVPQGNTYTITGASGLYNWSELR